MRICLYQSATDNDPLHANGVEWEQLKSLLSEFEERETKDGKAWSPTLVDGLRSSENVQSICCAVFDLDEVTNEQVVVMTKALDGLEYVYHSTFSHTPDSNCLRLVLPLEKPFEKKDLTTASYQAEWQAIRTRIIEQFKIPADPTCKDLSRLYFLPTSRPDSGRISESNSGARLAYENFSTGFGGGNRAQESEREEVCEAGSIRSEGTEILSPTGRSEGDSAGGQTNSIQIDLAKARDKLRALDKNRDLITRVLVGDVLAPNGERDDTLQRLASIVAWTVPSLPVEGFIEIIYKSLCSMALEAEEGTPEFEINYWLELAKAKFARAEKRLVVVREEEATKIEELKAAFGLRNDTSTPPPFLHPRDEKWRELLQWTNDEVPHLKNSAANLLILLRYSDEWRGAFRLNLVTKDVEVTRGPIPPGTDPDIIPVMVADWFSIFAKPDEQLRIPVNDVQARIAVVAWEHKYDPLVNFLDSLEWDGVDRLNDAPFRYFAAYRHNDAGDEISKHVSTVFKRWMVGAVARAYEPGCKMDNVLILESEQGQRKSTALKILGGDFFSDANFVVGDKDGSMIIGRTWICELAEMDNVRSTEPASHRAFFSRRKDTFRAPYGRVIKDWPRRCMFVGSINPDGGGYLKDLTGNRRYWPIAVGIADTISLVRDRNAIWAEAVAIYKQAFQCVSCSKDVDGRCPEHRWWLSKQEEFVAEKQAEQRLEIDDTQAQIEAWWRKTPIAMRPITGITTSELAIKLGFTLAQVTRAVQIRMGHGLRKLDWKMIRTGSTATRKYLPPEAFLAMPEDKFFGTAKSFEAQA